MSAELCFWCDDEHRVDVLEVYPEERTFTLDCCCEGAEADARAELTEADPRELGRWLQAQTGIACRQIVDDVEAAGAYGNGGIRPARSTLTGSKSTACACRPTCPAGSFGTPAACSTAPPCAKPRPAGSSA